MSKSARHRMTTQSPESGKKVMFILQNQQIACLDHIVADIRAKTGTIIKRTEVVRAFVEALAKSRIDLTTATSEAEIAAILTKKLKM